MPPSDRMTRRISRQARLDRAERLADEMQTMIQQLEDVSTRLAEELRHDEHR